MGGRIPTSAAEKQKREESGTRSGWQAAGVPAGAPGAGGLAGEGAGWAGARGLQRREGASPSERLPRSPRGQHPEAHSLSDRAQRASSQSGVCLCLGGPAGRCFSADPPSLCVCCVQKCMFTRVRHVGRFLIVLLCFCAEKHPPQESRHSPAVTQLILVPCHRGPHHPPGACSWGLGGRASGVGGQQSRQTHRRVCVAISPSCDGALVLGGGRGSVLHQEGMRSPASITSAAPSALNLTLSDTDIKPSLLIVFLFNLS